MKQRIFIETVSQQLKVLWQRRLEVSEVSIVGYSVLALVFLLQVAIARILGTEGFGIYSMTLALVAFVEVPLVTRGSEIALRNLGKSWQSGDVTSMKMSAQRMIKYDLILYASTFTLLALIAWITFLLSEVDPWLFIILALTIPAQTGFGVFKSYFMVFGKIVELARYELLYAVLLILLSLAGIYLWGVFGLATALVIAQVLKTFLAYYFTRKYIPQHESTTLVNGTELCLTSEGGFSIVRNLFQNGFNQIDIILLGVLQKPEIVGLYKVGKSLASLPTKISFPVWRYLHPRLLAAIQKGDKKREKRLIISGALVLGLMMLFVSPFILLYGKAAIIFLYGESYRDAFDYFLILVIGVWVFHGITGWFKFWVVITDSRWFGLIVYAIAFCATIILGFLFVTADSYAMSCIMTLVMTMMSIVAFLKVFRT